MQTSRLACLRCQRAKTFKILGQRDCKISRSPIDSSIILPLIQVSVSRFVVLHLLFLVVGLGSTVFHMTLK